MRFIILLPCFIFAFLTFLSSVSYGFSYDIDSFTQVGGASGTSIFFDDFDDGFEPPSGPSGSLPYAAGSFSSNAESLGFLNLNSNDAAPADEPVIGAGISDSTYWIHSGSGGGVQGKFRFTNGFETNTGFSIQIFGAPLAFESSTLWIQKDVSGSIVAFFDFWTPAGTIIDQKDITGQLGTSTDITLRLEVSTADVVTASLDIGSDGSFIDMLESYTLTSSGGSTYTGGFLGFADPIPEPTTIALLGIGLVGLAGVGARRRRKKKAVDKS